MLKQTRGAARAGSVQAGLALGHGMAAQTGRAAVRLFCGWLGHRLVAHGPAAMSPGGVSTKKGRGTKFGVLQCPGLTHTAPKCPPLCSKKLCKQFLLPMAGISSLPPACRNMGRHPGGLRYPQPDEKCFRSPALHYCLFSSRLSLHLWLSNPPTSSFTAG